jgi:2-keto-3-deoxy-L-rhamnonate aldolase RhmA
MRHNQVKRACLEGRVQVGSFIATNDPLCAQIMANSGFEWVLVDMEHGPVPISALQTAVIAIRTTETEPFVRAAWNSSAAIQTALDSGVSGIMIPMISTRAEAEAAVRDARYLPVGERSRGPMRAVLSFGTDFAGYSNAANTEVLVMAQIETAEAIENLDDIASVEGIDCLFIGPNDLASTYGVAFPPAWEHKDSAYFKAIAGLPAVARKHGKIAGIQVVSPEMANECIALGFTLVGVGADAGFLWNAARRTRAEVNARP